MNKIIIRRDLTPGEKQELNYFCKAFSEGVAAAYLGQNTFIELECSKDAGCTADSLQKEAQLRMQAAREYSVMSWLSKHGDRYVLRTKEGIIVIGHHISQLDDQSAIRKEMEAIVKSACSNDIAAILTQTNE